MFLLPVSTPMSMKESPTCRCSRRNHVVNGFLVGFRRAIAFHDRRIGQGVNLAGLDHLLETSRIEQYYSRGTGGVERNRDSRLLIALYSWSMAASKAILLFHRETLPAILFSRFNETSSSTALNFASEFSFSKSFDPRRSVQLNDYLSGGDGSRWIGSRFI